MSYSEHYIDSHHFTYGASHFRGGQLPSIKSLLNKQLVRVRGYQKFIPEYPQVRCLPLEFFYTCYHCICAMDAKLFEDITNRGSRSLAWASWLALVTPYPESYMLQQLEQIIEKNSDYSDFYILTMAIRRLEEQTPECQETADMFSEYGSFITLLPRIKIPLRPSPTEHYFKQRRHRAETIANIYKNKGTDTAIAYIKSLPVQEEDMDYKEWLRLQALREEHQHKNSSFLAKLLHHTT
ncbi:hypothetical protein HCH_01965 [Hahella chejuensis KCTC 2396]|uniref:Uncharacterized protein n=2 Tax=Hahella chejuensis TaxID=158327 RepID=Q2SKM5_HAHCH|nr:hypothetical protein HCH_01965 [Hahella chejuensis KCTC 2396]